MFSDYDAVPEWLRPLLAVAVERGLINGYPDNTIRVDQTLTRAEYIAGIARLAMLIEELLDHDRDDLMRKVADAVVEVRSNAGLGSGVLLRDGYVLTNAHVVGDDADVLVRWTSPLASDRVPKLYDKRYPVVKKDVGFDLALIHVPDVADVEGYVDLADEWTKPQFEEVDREHFGETLYTQGSPVGLSGVLSRGLFAGHEFYGNGFFLTFAGSINPGNSGGGVFDTSGRLVGIAVAKPDNALVDGIGFAVPPLIVQTFLSK